MQINNRIKTFFTSLSDVTRLKIVTILSKGPKPVTEIHAKIKEITLSAISHQLKYLSNANIVKYQKKGREKIYHLSDSFCWCILRDAKKHFKRRNSCKRCSKIK